MQNSQTKRLFIALNLPLNIKKYLADLLPLLSKNNQGVKWVNYDGLHLTLHFLGYLNNRLSEEVINIMQTISGKFGEIEFNFKEIGAFPDLIKPRVIFLAGEQVESKSVFKLQELLGQELAKIGISIDRRAWKLHITIGRVKIQNFNLRLPPDFKIEPLNFKVSNFELMESELRPTGAAYTVIKSFKI